ncbi:hypothetical protein D9758_002237 [Tetrapyrgos nigripes]|uniref:RNA-dependent RNA polymerase n=1 Tax=Tetrapyrgos nigripes TaxID=182062 RepID=A0A8H5GPR6_9AGAR|nr:hypothetical protein D9758_002237 [Tetrapyrgos nigripes]
MYRAGLGVQLVAAAASVNPKSSAKSSAQPSRPCLSQQTLRNIHYNGVPATVFEELLQQGTEVELEPLLDWSCPESVWVAVARIGQVARGLMDRRVPATSRALGFSGREWAESNRSSREDSADLPEICDDEEMTIDLLSIPSDAGTGRNELTKAPFSLHESVVEMLQAGFHPTLSKLKKTSGGCRIPLPKGTAPEAFVIPDPSGRLKEGEVYFYSSQGMTDPLTQIVFHVVIGEVLVVAVDIPELRKYPDVIIVPVDVAGYESLSFMSMLSGGDLDGDTLFMTWYPELVRFFRGTSLILPPANLEKKCFESQVETVSDFVTRLTSMPLGSAQRAFLRSYLSGLSKRKVGTYSHFHDIAVKNMATTLRKLSTLQACMRSFSPLCLTFNTELDSGKTGLRLKDEVYESDLKNNRQWSRELEQDTKKDIIDQLADCATALREKILTKYDQDHGLVVGYSHNAQTVQDQVLLKPFNDAKARCETFVTSLRSGFDQGIRALYQEELCLITSHVDKAYTLFKSDIDKHNNAACLFDEQISVKPQKVTHKEKTSNQNYMRQVQVKYTQPLSSVSPTTSFLISNLEEVKASYAYSLSETFGFCVAYRDLCKIKATASPGGLIPTTARFDEFKIIPGHHMRALKWR